MDEFSLKTYLALDKLLTAFKPRDVQAVGIVYEWVRSHGYTVDDVMQYLNLLPRMEVLHQVGYFYPQPSPEHAKKIRDFERDLPGDLRRVLRHERLSRLSEGPIHR